MSEQVTSRNPFEHGPYIQAAAFCEKILQEGDGVLSLIRLIDRVILTASGPDAPAAMPPQTVQFSFAICLKSGSARGSYEISIQPESPSGIKLGKTVLPVFLEGEDRGQNIVAPTAITVDQQGLYWFEIKMDEQLLTRVPLRIVYQRISAGT
jgi:hypothetical protein